jgi:hypothetical protein
MALLYLFDEDGIAVDEDGWEWEHVDGTWRPKAEGKVVELRLVVTGEQADSPA